LTNSGSGIVPKGEDFFNLPGGYVANYVWSKEFINGSILDVGCGFGYGTNFLAKNTSKPVIGIDNDKKAIKYAKEHYIGSNLTFLLADLNEVFFEEKFDLIVSFEVIEHLSDANVYLQKIAEFLEDKSTFLLSTPNRKYTEQFYINGRNINFYHIHEYYPSELEELLQRYFKIAGKYRHYHPDLLLNKMNVEEIKKQWAREIKIPTWIRKKMPENIKDLGNKLLNAKKTHAHCGLYKEYHIEEVDDVMGISELYRTQIYRCVLK